MSTPGNYPPPPPPKNPQYPPAPQQNTSVYPEPATSTHQGSESRPKMYFEAFKNTQKQLKQNQIDSGEPQTKGFFASLFDFKFQYFVALKFAGFLYTIALVASAFIGFTVFSAMYYSSSGGYYRSSPSGGEIFFFLIVSLVVAFLALVAFRLAIEVFIAVIRIAENTTYIRYEAHNTNQHLNNSNNR